MGAFVSLESHPRIQTIGQPLSIEFIDIWAARKLPNKPSQKKRNYPEPRRVPSGGRSGSHCRHDLFGSTVGCLVQAVFRQVGIAHRDLGIRMAKGLLDLVERVSCVHQHRSIGMPEVVQPEIAQLGFQRRPNHQIETVGWPQSKIPSMVGSDDLQFAPN